LVGEILQVTILQKNGSYQMMSKIMVEHA